MLTPVAVVKAMLRASWIALCKKPRQAWGDAGVQAPAIIPIRSLGVNQRVRIAAHLLSLSANDRYLRFGYAVQDAQIQRYVQNLDFERDEILGIFDRKLALLAVAHLAYGQTRQAGGCAEFGVSVVSRSRGRGYGARLFERAVMHAVNQGVSTLLIHALSENTAMLKIARAAGARVTREGAESEAYLQLPRSTLNTRMAELVHDNIAEADYRFKRQLKLIRKALTA